MVNSKQVPLFALRRRVLFPGIPLHCAVAHPDDLDMIRQLIRGERWLGVLPVFHPEDPNPGREDLAGVVCLSRIRRVHWMPDGGLLMELLGIARARVKSVVARDRRFHCADLEVLRANLHPEALPDGWLRQAQQELAAVRTAQASDPYPPGIWLDLLCHFLPIPFEAKLQLLCELSDLHRCQLLEKYRPYWKAERLMRRYLPKLYRSN